MNVAIKLNTVPTYEPCAFCGEYVKVDTGPGLFLAEDWTPVCLECGQHHAPILLVLLRKESTELTEAEELPF